MRRTAFILIAWVTASLAVRGQYYDWKTDLGAADYIDSVEQTVGAERFDKISRTHAFMLAKTLGQIDRSMLRPEAFVEHVEMADEVRGRFYNSLNTVNYRTYLLPIRIRSELLPSQGWRKVLRDQLDPLVAKHLSNVDEAATVVLAWCNGKVKMLDQEPCYPLGLKGDLDPITTLRGGYGSEIDISILAVAALRSVGIAARIVFAPVIAQENGGKVWIEYRSQNEWKPWVASAPAGADGKQYLLSQFGGRFTMILANPDQPINITASYVSVAHVHVTLDDFDPEDRPGWNLLVKGSQKLSPVTGRNIYMYLPSDVEVGAGDYLLVAGDRAHLTAIEPISLKPGQSGSYELDGKDAGTQSFEVLDQPNAPAALASGNDQEMDPSTVRNPAMW
jgi:hypothetical protein